MIFFMHVKGSTSMIKMAAVGGFFWLLIFGAFVLADVLTRPDARVSLRFPYMCPPAGDPSQRGIMVR